MTGRNLHGISDSGHAGNQEAVPGTKRVRLADAGDVKAMAAISAQEYDRWSAADFEQSMRHPFARIWVCEETLGSSREILGYAVLYFDEDGSELMHIAVDRGRRRERIATRMIERVFAFIHNQQIPQVMLEVRAENDAAGVFYRKAGFRVNHIVRDYYRNPTDDAVKMLRRFK